MDENEGVAEAGSPEVVTEDQVAPEVTPPEDGYDHHGHAIDCARQKVEDLRADLAAAEDFLASLEGDN